MSSTELFNSKTKPVPRIRMDLDIIPINENGDSYLYFHDMRGYVTPNFALDRTAGGLLSLLDGQKSINDLKPHLGNGTTTDQLLQYVQFLDENRLLHSFHYKTFSEQVEHDYEQSSTHQSVTAGGSYPADPDELKKFLDEAFLKYDVSKSGTSAKKIKALYAPHIDPRVGMKSYVESFQKLHSIKPKRVVILATSHYAGLYPDVYQNKPFIISRKDFKMPLTTIQTDQKAVENLMEDAENVGLSEQDRAHRMEHSIELHLLFLSYIWQHDFSIIPILIGGFDDLFYTHERHLSKQVDSFSTRLKNQFGHDDETLFLISGDLAHTGKKFGDDVAASALKNEVKQFDQAFLESGEQASTYEMLQLMKRNYDPYRICGFPALYTFLKAFPNIKGETINYDRWDETERESAVTFGSILY